VRKTAQKKTRLFWIWIWIDDETDEEELEAEEEWDEREFVSDLSEDDEDGLSDLEDIDDERSVDESESEDNTSSGDHPKTALGKRKASERLSKTARRRPDKKTKKGPRHEVEYETEVNTVPLSRSTLAN